MIKPYSILRTSVRLALNRTRVIFEKGEIVRDPDGEFVFRHDDGDLFQGHQIAIGGRVEEGPMHADI